MYKKDKKWYVDQISKASLKMIELETRIKQLECPEHEWEYEGVVPQQTRWMHSDGSVSVSHTHKKGMVKIKCTRCGLVKEVEDSWWVEKKLEYAKREVERLEALSPKSETTEDAE